jgi:hypothetical protein
VTRVVTLGFEIRIELELADGAAAYAQLDRATARVLDLHPGDAVLLGADDDSALAGARPSAP